MPCNPRVVTQVSISIFEIRTMPMFTKQLAISIDAINVFGASSRFTILLKDGCCLVFRRFISFNVREKKAISEPDTRNDIKNKIITVNRSMVVAAGEIARKRSVCWLNKCTE